MKPPPTGQIPEYTPADLEVIPEYTPADLEVSLFIINQTFGTNVEILGKLLKVFANYLITEIIT